MGLEGTGLIVVVAVVAVVIIAVAVFLIKRNKSGSAPADAPAEETNPVTEEVSEEEPAPVVSEQAEEKVEPEPAEEEQTSAEPIEEEPEDDEPEEGPDVEPAEEEPKAFIKPCPTASSEEPAKEKTNASIDTSFMSRLVASKDASEKVAEVPYWVPPVKTAADAVNEEPAEEEPVEEEPVDETLSEDIPVEETSEEEFADEPDVEPATEPASEPEPVQEAGDAAVDSESDQEEDTYTDYSPEALVRRAAWNKGLRCRRQYGDHTIQVAFVKPRVAVYVLDPSEPIADEEEIRAEGWTLLRFDMNAVTDGLSEGDIIAEAVKANLHAQKVSKKKSSKK